jgi:predicted transcriptional regulator
MATLVEIAGQVVASHAATSNLTTEELIAELSKVYAALKNLEAGHPLEGEAGGKPALTVKEAFKKNEVVCMVCGKGGFRALARHLSTAHDLKPGAYKKQFGIPSKQSLCAKTYSEARRAMAQERGLGDILAKAREVRMGNIEAKKAAPAKAAKAKAPVSAKAPAKNNAPAKAPKVKATQKVKK